MAKCDCYFQHGLKFLCYGTKEMEECSCGGDKSKCDFYPEKRQQKPKAKRQIVDAQEAKTFIDANWPNDPLLKQIVFNLLDKLPRVDAVEVEKYKALLEMYNDLRENFIDYVCSGTCNVAPYCLNRCEGCVDRVGWCIKGSDECHGFNPAVIII